WVANPHFDPEPFDPNVLPFDIADGVRIEAVQFSEGAFDLHRRGLGERLIEVMERVQYALVHRYNPDTIIVDGELIGEVQHNHKSEQLLREMAACLRLVRPIRQHAMMMHGIIRDEDGSFDVTG